MLAFTHGDRFKPLPGYQVMNHHYHMDLGRRLLDAGSPDAEIPDLAALKSLGINIVSQVDSVGFATPAAGRGTAPEGGRGAAPESGRGGAPAAGREGGPGGGRGRGDVLAITAASVEGARRHSDKTFLVMPNQELYGSPVGGHTDLLFSHPVYWTQGRTPGSRWSRTTRPTARSTTSATAADLMEMAKREDVLISMPHPRTKGSTGFPDAIKDEAYFKDPHYQGVGFRWGMGLDLSEQRFCEHRCQTLLDDMSNWPADLPGPPKYLMAISEVRYQAPGDDIYSSSPVSYLKLAQLPPPTDVEPGDQDADARRLLRHLRRSADSVVDGAGHRHPAHGRRRRGVDVPAGVRGSDLGRRQEDRSQRRFRPPSCRRSASTASRFRSTRPARSGCASPRGIRPATARWSSQ